MKLLEREKHSLSTLLRKMLLKIRVYRYLLETDLRVWVKRCFSSSRMEKYKQTIYHHTKKMQYSLLIYVEKFRRILHQNMISPVSPLGAYVYLAIYTLIIVILTLIATTLVPLLIQLLTETTSESMELISMRS